MSRKKQQDGKEPAREKKVKVIYYDDGSTIAEMGGTKNRNTPKAPLRERMRTFFGVMRKMVLPMLVTLAAFTLFYLIILWIAN